MYIRKITQKKKGDAYISFRLVENIRTDKGPRQRVILNLGTQFNVPSEQWKPLCEIITQLLIGQQSFLPVVDTDLETIAEGLVKTILNHHARQAPKNNDSPLSEQHAEFVTVDLNSLYHHDVRTVGGETICLEMMNRLGLPQLLEDVGFNSNQLALALGAIMARLLAPGSERAGFHWLSHQSATGELIDFDFKTTSLNRFYEIADRLHSKKEALENYLYQNEQRLFSLSEAVVLYDLTNTFFEGSGQFNDKARYGRSKEKRSDAPLVTLGLVLDGDGFAKKSRVFPGNVSEPGTLHQFLEQLTPAQATIHEKTVILDAGIATRENLDWLATHQYRYVVVSREKPNLPDMNDFIPLAKSGENEIRAKLIKNHETSEWELYVNSPSRIHKEQGIKTRFTQRMEEDLAKARRIG